MLSIQKRTIEFEIEKFCAATMLHSLALSNLSLDKSQVSVELSYHIEKQAHSILTMLRLPGQRLPRQLVAEYPATWWDHLKARLGWKHKTRQVFREDFVVTPNLKLPPDLSRNIRIYTTYRAEPAECLRYAD